MSERCLRVGFIGAGLVNFGGGEGPWDHASRIERLPNVRVVGVADPFTEAAESVLKKRRDGAYSQVYDACRVYSSTRELLQEARPDVVMIGTPPFTRLVDSFEFEWGLYAQYASEAIFRARTHIRITYSVR